MKFRVTATIAEVDPKTSAKGPFLRVKIASAPPIWASVWDSKFFDEVNESLEFGTILNIDLQKKGEFNTVKGVWPVKQVP
jgi:hypothetical protein